MDRQTTAQGNGASGTSPLAPNARRTSPVLAPLYHSSGVLPVPTLHSQNWKYIMYPNACRRGSSHSHGQHEQKIWQTLDVWFLRYACKQRDMLYITIMLLTYRVNGYILGEEYRWGVHLPYLRLEPIGG